jgi:hypothetical protein
MQVKYSTLHRSSILPEFHCDRYVTRADSLRRSFLKTIFPSADMVMFLPVCCRYRTCAALMFTYIILQVF